MSKAHIIRTTDHITGQITFLCGETRAERNDPHPDDPPCANCFGEAINICRAEAAEASAAFVDFASEGLRWIEALSLRVRRLERKVAKAERKGKEK